MDTMTKTWRRSRISAILPGLTLRMYDHWYRAGYWKPDVPPIGSGYGARVTLADLEGLAVLQVLAPYLFRRGIYRDAATNAACPSWSEIRVACEEGGLWIATPDGSWERWSAAPNLPSAVGVVVDVGALVAALRGRLEASF